MRALLVLPILIPLCTTAVALLFWSHRLVARWCSGVGAVALLAAGVALFARVWRGSGIASTQVGNWPAPFGITLVADILSAVMVVLAGIVGVAVVGYSLSSIGRRREAFGFHPLVHALLAGVCGAFLTGDLFNLYVWFEVMLIASFVLMGLGGERAQMVGAVKYVVLNLVSSALFLGAVGILYRLTGTLNLADLSRTLGAAGGADTAGGAAITVTSMLFLVAFGIKAAIFPLFFWLPASYHTPPIVISALFAGLLTKVGVYALIRVFTLLFIGDVGYTHRLILVLAGLTMVTGVLGAVAQRDVRSILSFHIVSQIGYMIMGLGLYTPLALAGSVFYILHHIVVKTNLFLIAGLINRTGGSFDLAHVGGLFRARPGLAALFLVSALSLAGIPPLSGFFAKLALVKAGLEAREYAIVAVALVVSLLTLYSMTKIWSHAFWEPAPPAGEPATRGDVPPASAGDVRRLTLPVIGLAAVTVCVSAAAAPVFAVASRAAEQLMDPGQYVRAVLGPSEAPEHYARR